MDKPLTERVLAHRNLLSLVIAIVALYVVLPQLGSFRNSLSLLRQASTSDVWPAVIAAVATYAAAAATYCFLAQRRLRYVRTLVIQLAGMFANRLVPAGLGNIGVNYRYLRQSGHSAVEAASVVTANNVIGVTGHLLLLGGTLALFHDRVPPLHVKHLATDQWRLVAVLALLVIVLLLKLFGSRLRRALNEFFKQLADYRHHPGKLLAALSCSLLVTISNVLALWWCCQAVGADVNFVVALLVFSLGITLGTATPTPGGLGGIEAGLVAGLLAYGVPGATALAAVLAFRLITYWLPLVSGSISLVFVQRKRYI